MPKCYDLLRQFKAKYPLTISWRLAAHSKIIEKHLNSNEEILYAFACQKDLGYVDIFNTYAVVITDKRLMIASKRLLFGYFFKSITPDMYNDLTVNKGIIWGKVIIDTVKEKVFLKNISGSALDEIETEITTYMMNEKKKYKDREEKSKDEESDE